MLLLRKQLRRRRKLLLRRGELQVNFFRVSPLSGKIRRQRTNHSTAMTVSTAARVLAGSPVVQTGFAAAFSSGESGCLAAGASR